MDIDNYLLSKETWTAAKKFKASMAVPPAHAGFLAEYHLPRFLYLSANDKGNNEMKPKALHRSPCICVSWGKPRKTSDIEKYRWILPFHVISHLFIFILLHSTNDYYPCCPYAISKIRIAKLCYKTLLCGNLNNLCQWNYGLWVF